MVLMRACLLILLLVLGFAPASGHAQTQGRWLTLHGRELVVLTTETAISLKNCKGETRTPHIALGVAANGSVRVGCWGVLDRHILIDWLDRSPHSLFERCDFQFGDAGACAR